jgi:uracil-DNA glycosylase
MAKADELKELYVDIRNCHECPRMDREKSLRLTQAVNTESDIFIVSQTLAANQLRKSGVNFFQADGHIGNTGSSLEIFLNNFQRTVYPPRQVAMSSNVIIAGCKPGYEVVYNTDIAQCYPGKKNEGRGDRRPDSRELQNCIGKGFLIREIEIIKPKLILLMGKASRDTFFDYILKVPYPESPAKHIQRIVENNELPWYTWRDSDFHILPIQHASGANPQFHEMLDNAKLIKLIQEVIDG